MAVEPEVSLVVNGLVHEGWKSVTVRSSIEELAHSFSVQYSQRWSPSGSPVAINAGDAVQIRIGDTLALTGYVDESSEDYDSSSHNVSVIGRSKTADLVDCAAIYKGGAIKGKDMLEVAALLCEPFGISVSLSDPDIDVGDPTNVQIEDGQSVFEVLSNLGRAQGVLLLSDASGNLILARAATEPKPSLELRYGESIKRGSVRSSARERFSTYLIKGQAAADPTLGTIGTSSLKYELADTDVPRYRPVVLLEHQATVAKLKQRATWERNTRAGAALACAYDVQGWTNIYGLWQPNTLLQVVDNQLGIDQLLLVTNVDLSRTVDGGRTARIDLSPREMFDVLKPPKAPKRKKRGRGAPPL